MGFRLKDNFISLIGVALSQLLLLLCFSLIGRYWGAEKLGDLNFGLSVGMFLGTISALRYELACVQDSVSESFFALRHVILIGFIVICAFYLAGIFIGVDGAEGILAFALAFMIQQAVSLYYVTKRNFVVVAVLKIAISLVFLGGVFLFLMAGVRPSLLEIYAYINLGFSLLLLARVLFLEKNLSFDFGFFKRNLDFPKYTLPATFFSSSVIYAVPIVIPFIYGATAAGFFAAAQRLGFFPVSLAAQSISSVLRREFVAAFNGQDRRILQIYVSYAKVLLFLAAAYVFFGNMLFDFVVVIVFGDGWAEAVDYFRALSVFYALQMIYVPLSQIFISTGNQRRDFFIQMIMFLMLVLAVAFSFALKFEIGEMLYAFSLMGSLAVIFGLFFTYSTVKQVSEKF